MTDEAQAQPVQQAQPAADPKSEAAAKAQEVGKKLTGFLGGLAEKAKNLDVKELAEKAKNIDVKELTEMAKQKVNEVKDKAAELNAGKAETAVPPRESVSSEEMKALFAKAAAAPEDLPSVIKAVLSDVAVGERIVFKGKFGTAADPVYAVLSDKTFYAFTKQSDQFLADIHPVSGVKSFSLLPPRGETAGRLTVFVENGDVKLTVATMEAYVNALILYKKMRELSGK